MTVEIDLKEDVARAVRAALAHGAADFHDVLLNCEGADPRLVTEVYDTLRGDEPPTRTATARRETSELGALFPAADPVACQWWFTLDTIESLATRVSQIAPPSAKVGFLGAPTVGYQFGRRFGNATVFDLDPHVVSVLQRGGTADARIYDAAHPLPGENVGSCDVVLTDPPWYPELLTLFLSRALELANDTGSVLCSLPPRLTRPGIVRERQNLLNALLAAGADIVSLERAATHYLVPAFERAALADLSLFDGRSWRSGDLLHVRKKGKCSLPCPTVLPARVAVFSRVPKRYRVFLRVDDETPGADRWVTAVPEFERTVSRRIVDPAGLHWWTTNKRGGYIRDHGLTKQALSWWQDGLDLEATREKLTECGATGDNARMLCRELDEILGLWTQFGTGRARRRPDLATSSSRGRPYVKNDDDGYRGPFQRDRDRITWSHGLRQLANKTQVFPFGSGDYLRNRLSHSLEVMQLASTIGASFELNQSLIEAGALAHDIGHTPFGHAGEDALDSLFKGIKSDLGFNHYEHGVDVVRWLEDAYQSPALGGLPGLNITSEVAECIFKHTYCQTGGERCQRELYRASKHRDYFTDDLCHLEGQAVRIADKVSYLVSDLEDGIRVGALKLEDLLSCQLLRRPPIDLVLAPGESLHERFISQRSLLLGIVMEDIIDSSAERLERIGTLSEVRTAKRYTVSHSDELAEEINEVWKLLQAGKLHRDARVRIANLRAARIVRELTLLFATSPELVDERFSAGHRRLNETEYMHFYRRRTGAKVKVPGEMLSFIFASGEAGAGDWEIPCEQLIQAKDFVAGLSDERARAIHHKLLAI